MKAPSEKHLEDWITFNLPRFGDQTPIDWYPEGYTDGWVKVGDDLVISTFADRVVARQMRFPCGIADLIVKNIASVMVVEIKKDVIDFATVGQCLRYIHELKQIFSYVYYRAVSSLHTPNAEIYQYNPAPKIEVDDHPECEVSGIVVGYSISDKHIPLIASACGIQVVTYDYDGEGYTFKHETPNHRGTNEDYQEYGYGALGDAMREIIAVRAASERAWREKRS